ncbi:uncharacterized protein LOC127262292 [Andrographis paniculata]|uniref:uncharacterized protein LOC127262292 n=1 Tax=Andrographis paniculata TaxID=175694 RepID=UPI0021E78941|nr:uncharacterized protein LOC127262292 [Andrographis paniculata]XP_051146877.1 uncharacterized protein LOC127262292 [Andrographis paniculata]
MERSEPSLAPEWYKSAGSSVGGNSSLHSDDHGALRVARNKPFVNGNGHDFGRSSSSERTTSSYFRRSSSSNSSGNFRSHSNTGRNHHDRDWDKEHYDSRDPDKSTFGDRRLRDFPETPGNNTLSKFHRDGLKRSQSMISGKPGGSWHNRVATESSSGNVKNGNGFLAKGSPVGGVNKKSFEKDFPSLGAEEKAVAPEIGRVPSPGLTTAIQSLPTATSSSLANEKWTSALAEVPTLVGSNGTVLPSVTQAAPSVSMPVTLGSTNSLNMAEAVAQGPSRTQTSSQLSVGTQRLEELAIKQSRQLIPVKPTFPKTLALNSNEKQKSKVGQQQQHPVSSIPTNFSARGGSLKPDVTKGSNGGKLQVLKPVREKNGVSPVAKDNVSPNGSKAANSAPAAPPLLSVSAATRGLPATVVDKRPSPQAQSRNDFFNLVRKKSMANSSSTFESSHNSASLSDASTAVPQSYVDVKHDSEMEAVSGGNNSEALYEPLHSQEKSDSTSNGDDAQKYAIYGNKYLRIPSEECEIAFLRLLGWEEDGEDEGLTDEEINDFITKHVTSKSSPFNGTLLRVSPLN